MNMDIVIVDKKENKFSAQINGKQIELSLNEFGLMQRLLNAVMDDYSGKVYSAYMEDNGIIKLISKK